MRDLVHIRWRAANEHEADNQCDRKGQHHHRSRCRSRPWILRGPLMMRRDVHLVSSPSCARPWCPRERVSGSSRFAPFDSVASLNCPRSSFTSCAPHRSRPVRQRTPLQPRASQSR
jgi:hypothetical protein